MANNMPSMTALLGLLAVAGWQNRDKIAEVIRETTGGSPAASPAGGAQSQGGLGGGGIGGGGLGGGGLGGLLSGITGGQQGGLGNILGGLAAGGGAAVVANGLQELITHLQQNGLGQQASSWVSNNANEEVTPQQIAEAIDPNVLSDVSGKTGVSQKELLDRLSQLLPQAVDSMTPSGRLPAAS